MPGIGKPLKLNHKLILLMALFVVVVVVIYLFVLNVVIPLRQELTVQIITTVLVVALPVVILYVLLRKKFVRPIESLTYGIEEISKKSSDVPIDKLSIDDRAMRRSDEVGALAKLIDLMIQRIKAAQELERLMTTKEKASLVLETTPWAVILYDSESNPIDCNEQALKLYKHSDKETFLREICTQRAGEHIHGNAYSRTHFQKALREGYLQISGIQLNRVDGSVVTLELTLIRVRYGVSHALLEYIRDITEEVEAEENALKLERELAREQERKKQDRGHSERIQAMLDATPLSVEIWDKDLNVIDCNKTTAEIYGYRSKNDYLEDFHNYKLRYGNTIEAFLKEIKKTFDTGTNKFEFEDIDSLGQLMYIEVDSVCLSLGNEPVVISYAKNVTEIKKAAAERQRLAVAEESNMAKSRFLARMSHEIRTPIAAVLGISEIELQSTEFSGNLKESLTKIHNAAGRLLYIVNDLLDLSKLEAGKMEVFSEEYEVAHMISEVSQMHPEYHLNEDVEFKLIVDRNTPALLIGDMLKIMQVLTNVLSNAFKYTVSGYVEMEVRCVEHETDEELVLLEVVITDTGHGMTKEQIDLLKSNEYVRFHESENRDIIGTGLGMPVVFNLLSLMDAGIDIVSEIDAGTKLTISIPQRLAGNKEVIGKGTALSLQNFDGAPLFESKEFSFTPEPMPYGSVLIVDDVETNLYVAKGLLAFYKIKAETCASGYEAIELVKQGKVYDIVFVDYMMKGLNGIETMNIMRGMGYNAPIIALTANAMTGQAQKFIKEGFDDFVSKPIQIKVLNTILIKNIRDRKPPEVVSKARKENNWRDIGDISDFQSNDETIKELRREFVKSHKDTYAKLCEMIDCGDLESAHILIHSLKGFAGLIKFSALSKIASQIEKVFDSGGVPPRVKLFELGNEIDWIIANIGETED